VMIQRDRGEDDFGRIEKRLLAPVLLIRISWFCRLIIVIQLQSLLGGISIGWLLGGVVIVRGL
jgi:hypothetical protein